MVLFRAARATGYALLTVADAAVRTYDRARRIGRALLPRRRADAFPLARRRATTTRFDSTILPPPGAYEAVHGALCRCGKHRGRTYTLEGIHDRWVCPPSKG